MCAWKRFAFVDASPTVRAHDSCPPLLLPPSLPLGISATSLRGSFGNHSNGIHAFIHVNITAAALRISPLERLPPLFLLLLQGLSIA